MSGLLASLEGAGQVSRTWTYRTAQAKTHTINLHHDQWTGVRHAFLDFEEIEGSLGHSTVLMDRKISHDIAFKIDDSVEGFLTITKSGLFGGFIYSCTIDGAQIAEVTQQVSTIQEDAFRVRVYASESTPDDAAEKDIVWYLVETTRLLDGQQTTVHRRFREFDGLLLLVQQNLRGHHLYASLPQLPQKTYYLPREKQTDPAFVASRLQCLDQFLTHLCSVPHVSDMTCTQAFLGFVGSVREYSVVFHQPLLGITLHRGPDEAVVVGGISPPGPGAASTPAQSPASLSVGDGVSKLNGLPLGEANFNGAVARIRGLPRPLVVHFITVLKPSTS